MNILNRIILEFTSDSFKNIDESYSMYKLLNREQIKTDNYALYCSLENNILYIDSLKIYFKINKNNNTYIKNCKVVSRASNFVKPLLELEKINQSHTSDSNVQEIVLVNEKTPLFQLTENSKPIIIKLLLRLHLETSSSYKYTIPLYFNFNYNNFSKVGDVNGDNKVTIKDLVELSDHIRKKHTVKYPEAGDMNGDGTQNVTDLVMLANFIARDGDKIYE